MLTWQQIILIICGLLLVFWLMNNNKKGDNKLKQISKDTIYHEDNSTENVSAGLETFWTRIVNMDDDSNKIYQYELPANFVINPKYLQFHPNFTVSPNRTIHIITDEEAEATTMLHLWVALNMGLLDNEVKFSELFTRSIRNARANPNMINTKLKQEIINLLYQEQQPVDNDLIEFDEDLALSEVQYQNPPRQEPETSFSAFGGESGLASF